jgi:hypothetical protein
VTHIETDAFIDRISALAKRMVQDMRNGDPTYENALDFLRDHQNDPRDTLRQRAVYTATLLAVNVYHEEAEPFRAITGSLMKRQLILTFGPGLDHDDDDDLVTLYRHLNTLLLIGKVDAATVIGDGQARTITAETIMCGDGED